MENILHQNVRPGGVRNESIMRNVKRPGGRSIVDIHKGDRAVNRKLIVNYSLEVTMRPSNWSVKSSGVTHDPILPRSWLIRKEFVDKFHKQALVLSFQIFYPKAPITFANTNIFPSNKTFGSMAGILPSPEESMTTVINGFDHCLRDGHSRHEVKWDGAEHNTR